MPAIRRIVREAAPGYKLSDVILGIARSVPFQVRRSAPDSTSAVAADVRTPPTAAPRRDVRARVPDSASLPARH
jgi:hypothetical protein